MTEAMRPHLDRVQTRALIVGIVGIAATAAGLMMNQEQFFRSYLLAFVYWMGVTLGSLGLLMLHHMVGGGWGVAIRRGLEAGTRTLPLMFVFFIPIAFGMHSLYEWTHADVVAKDTVLQHKSAFLNTNGFLIRAVVYFVVWGFLIMRLHKGSSIQEAKGYWGARSFLQRVSAPGLIVHVLIATLASVDWIMSLEPHWFSTVYGIIFIVGGALTTFAFMIIVVRFLTQQAPMEGMVSSQTFHDLGNLMFAFNMFWAYVSFSQLIIIWSANLPEEITYYAKRLNGGYEYVALAVFLFHFAVPFLLLLLRKHKRQPQILVKIAVWMMLMRLLDLFWVITPAFGHDKDGVPMPHVNFHWLDIAAPIALGGIWVWFFMMQLKKRSLEPLPVS
ncbi:MAG: hypothetical protein HYZ37_19190 [Candidatus Solibacter usitatus]|nr:hypothetical protein [Candidatus Solibacter usitatus]